MKNEREVCKLCPNTICYESTSNEGRVRVDINPIKHEIRNITKNLIADCPIKKMIEDEDLEDRSLY